MAEKDWKAITLDWVNLLDYDQSETINICLTQRQVAILKALLITAYWPTRWTNLTISNDQLDAFVSQLDNQLDGNDCEGDEMDFRDNPNDPCEVQYSTDGGNNWQPMFRKDNCISGASGDEITNIYTDIDNIETNNTTWAGDITNVAPKWGYVDADSDKALCWAVGFYVDMVCDTSISQIKEGNAARRDQNDWLDDLSDMLGGAVIATVAFFSATPITWPAVALTALAWASTQIIDEVWDWVVSKDYTDFEDEDAKDTIKCAMYQEMEGSTVEWTKWRDSLSYFTSYGGAEQSIAGAVHKWNQSVDVFINYMMMTEELNDIRATLPVCPCPATWEHTWDFATHGLEAWVLTAQQWGTWTEGVGMVGQEVFIDPNWQTTIRLLTLDEAVPRCDKAEMFVEYIAGDFEPGVVTCIEFIVPPKPTLSLHQGFLAGPQTSWFHTFVLGDLDSVSLFLRVSRTESGDRGSSKIHSVTLSGVGVDPFSGRETS